MLDKGTVKGYIISKLMSLNHFLRSLFFPDQLKLEVHIPADMSIPFEYYKKDKSYELFALYIIIIILFSLRLGLEFLDEPESFEYIKTYIIPLSLIIYVALPIIIYKYVPRKYFVKLYIDKKNIALKTDNPAHFSFTEPLANYEGVEILHKKIDGYEYDHLIRFVMLRHKQHEKYDIVFYSEEEKLKSIQTKIRQIAEDAAVGIGLPMIETVWEDRIITPPEEINKSIVHKLKETDAIADEIHEKIPNEAHFQQQAMRANSNKIKGRAPVLTADKLAKIIRYTNKSFFDELDVTELENEGLLIRFGKKFKEKYWKKVYLAIPFAIIISALFGMESIILTLIFIALFVFANLLVIMDKTGNHYLEIDSNSIKVYYKGTFFTSKEKVAKFKDIENIYVEKLSDGTRVGLSVQMIDNKKHTTVASWLSNGAQDRVYEIVIAKIAELS